MRTSLVLTFCAVAIRAQSQSTAARPRITGIDHVSFYTTDADGVRTLYGGTLGLWRSSCCADFTGPHPSE